MISTEKKQKCVNHSAKIITLYKFVGMEMERRPARVSEAQWSILLEYLERNPNLVRARGYNNSARGRAESSHHWEKVAGLLNAERSGTTKTPKDWAVYVSNYKSKVKKLVADINNDTTATDRGNSLTDRENHFLGIIGSESGQTAPQVAVQPFPDANRQQPSTSPRPQNPQIIHIDMEDVQRHEEVDPFDNEAQAVLSPNEEAQPVLPRRRRRERRYRSRPMAPLEEARRILSETHRAAADAANARALHLIGQNLGRLADAVERIVSQFSN